jgi:hypothetical protein
MAAPLASDTFPVMIPLAPWPHAIAAITNAAANRKRFRFKFFMFSPR